MTKKITLSVHGLVDFVLRTGDIDNRVFNLETMTRGTQIHAYYQAKQNAQYLAEQYLDTDFTFDDLTVRLHGRVDGIIINGDDVIIEEIKTTNSDLNTFATNHKAWHLGQAECYALMYCLKNNRDKIGVQLTYISQVDATKMLKNYMYTRHELMAKVAGYFAIYLRFYNQVEAYTLRRDKQIEKLNFPFPNVRLSQKIMMDEVERALETNEHVYINAPTGSGKTMAALFPSIKELAKREGLKIFYLTAKGSGKLQAEQALNILDNEVLLKRINLHAKEKMCLNDKISCNPDQCPFAVNYYGKLKDALFDIYTNYDDFNYETVMHIAKKHELCPFEFQLDLSLLADVIIADYNYLFDPFVYLRRFFETKNNDYVVLIDEAHNLPRRVMDNYSKTLDFSVFYSFRKLLKGPTHKSVRLLINKIAKYLDEYKNGINEVIETINEFPAPLLTLLEKLMVTGSEYMQEAGEEVVEEFADFFFSVNKFLKIHLFIDDDFALFTEIDEERRFFPKFTIKCLNSERFIREALRGINHAIFFSATLAPEQYFKTMLGVKEEIMHVPNPFAKEQLLIMVDANTSLYFKDREQTIDTVAQKIIAATSVKTGNYLVYTPSFYYLEKLEQKLFAAGIYNLAVQRPVMSESDKISFLDTFVLNPPTTQIGLAVLGGSFSEGVDLVSDRLTGVIILGVGYPPPSFEKELEAAYFDKNLNAGQEYAYIYPALNKILQTMGRVIRTETDYGFVLLMDKRYNYDPYRTHLRNYHGKISSIKDSTDINNLLANFLLN